MDDPNNAQVSSEVMEVHSHRNPYTDLKLATDNAWNQLLKLRRKQTVERIK